MKYAMELRSIADKVNTEREERNKERVRQILNALEQKFISAAESGSTHVEIVCIPNHPFAYITEEAEEILEQLGYKDVVVKPNYLYVAW